MSIKRQPGWATGGDASRFGSDQPYDARAAVRVTGQRSGCLTRQSAMDEPKMILDARALPGLTWRPAGFEPATRCLEGTFEPSRVRRLTSLYELSNSSYCRWPSDGVA